MASWQIGEIPRITATFTDATGANVDPGALVVKIKTPAGVVTTYTFGAGAFITKDGVGVYHIDLNLTAEGSWFYRFEGTGANQVAGEGTIFVSNSEFY